MEKENGSQLLDVEDTSVEKRTSQNSFLLYFQYIALVKSIINKFNYPSQIDYDDLCQIGIIAVIECLDKYDPNKGEFSSYALVVIYNRIIEYINKWKISFSIPFCNTKNFRAKRIINKNYRLSGEDFEKKSFSIDNLNFIQKEMLSSYYDSYSEIELNLFLDKLEDKERLILLQKDILGGTESEIARYHHISQQRVNQIYKNTILKLRNLYSFAPVFQDNKESIYN